ncbi:hypothetical protein [Azospirillum lipoferum]|uniref:Uncharacterized protein n=1 Tax=Azospirillum lipoferum (strain 4B) TaxID=862719 RepID=G7Z734_AZOL4|nr:hypothetical protein [Azospirillum lipoferum]CBS86750.1 protein of unknown function [Azospirillum lipoferum 4B]
MATHTDLNAPVYEKFNLGIFLLGLLAAALMLLILPIGFIFHPSIILYAALLGTALYFVAIWMMTAGAK